MTISLGPDHPDLRWVSKKKHEESDEERALRNHRPRRDWRSAAWPRPRGSPCSATPAWVSATTSTTTAASPSTTSGDTDDDLRAVSRVRFGVNMTGETDSGITFGATIRADNAIGGQGGPEDQGQTAGSVFVSGSWGTLTFGDTNGADEQWVGDVPGNYSLTGLTDFNETQFVSNGGSFGNDTGNNFAANPFARPTVRYDFDIMGFGLSLSSNRDLTDIGVGTGYAADFGGGSWSVGAGYYKFDSFTRCRRSASSSCVETDGTGDHRGHGRPDRTVLPGRRAVVGRPGRRLRGLRLRRHLRQDHLEHRGRGRGRGRQHPGRRLVRLGRLRGRCLLGLHPERQRPATMARTASKASTATPPTAFPRSTTSAAAPRSTAASSRPTAARTTTTRTRRAIADFGIKMAF